MKLVIIDDEKRARKALSTLITEQYSDIEICGEADGIKSGLELISKYNPDLILLDIHLKKESGFDLFKYINHEETTVIFITAYSEYAIKAIKFSALDYLLKPIDPEELKMALDRAIGLKNRNQTERFHVLDEILDSDSDNPNKIVLSDAQGFTIVELKEVIRCEGERNYTTFHLKDNTKITTTRTLIEFERLLSGGPFFRIYKSHLINLKYVKGYKKGKGGFAIMTDETELPVSREKKHQFLDALKPYLA
ncbi:MAG: response regulator transcription factor [Crocinitomicaceae bacterium]|nr:LytTR family DNA-binding domain-containing protein [Flavobacteriales bacterium]NQZ37014.1 response regulator transcription factor [Crocinitomicaceae bacterium]